MILLASLVRVLPCISVRRRNFRDLEGATLGPSPALLPCATGLAGFAIGAAIVFRTLAGLPGHCS